MRDDSQSLELMRALECKQMYESLKEDCSAEQFIGSAHETAMAIKRGTEDVTGLEQPLYVCELHPQGDQAWAVRYTKGLAPWHTEGVTQRYLASTELSRSCKQAEIRDWLWS